MNDDIGFNDFDIEEPEDGDHQDGDYGGEVKPWQPFETKSLSSNIQEVRSQKFFQESYINRIKSGQRIDQEEMRQWLVHWLTTMFAIWTTIGLIALVITKDGMLLSAILSSTGLFLTLLTLIFRHYFQRSKQ
jgi:hypothetical protein